MLRGINVGGRNKVAMADLRALFVELGHDPVVTYVQSGNVVFGTPSRRPAELAQAIEDAIAGELGLEVTVLLRSRAELVKVASGNPFLAAGADPTKLHVTFLGAAPDRARAGAVEAPPGSPDDFRVAGREVYLHCPAGYGRTKLDNTFWERRLGVRATTRNWTTVTKLLELASTPTG
jgi:uncharacterized protein (DUF1697 family)